MGSLVSIISNQSQLEHYLPLCKKVLAQTKALFWELYTILPHAEVAQRRGNPAATPYRVSPSGP